MALSTVELGPYLSFVVTRIPEDADPQALYDEVYDHVLELLEFEEEDSVRRSQSEGASEGDADLQVSWVHYVTERVPGWYVGDDPKIKDQVNHLVLLAMRERHIAFYASEALIRQRIQKSIEREEMDEVAARGLALLSRVPPGVLNASFVDGPALTLWLAGLHRRTSSKADRKILAGGDLRDALDPLADQSYAFTAARCLSSLSDGNGQVPVGVSPRKSSVWAGPVRSWPEFESKTAGLLGRVQEFTRQRKSEQKPLPHLAYAVLADSEVEGPYDVLVVDPSVLEDDQALSDDQLALARRWADYGRFEVLASEGPSFKARVGLEDDDLGTFQFDVRLHGASARLEVERLESSDHPLASEAARVLNRADWVTIYYDSGHTFSGGQLFSQRFRDVRFNNWVFLPIAAAGFAVGKEKPGKGSALDIPAIGKGKESLFSWVQKKWPMPLKTVADRDIGTGQRSRGYLTCDDGGGEIADFIHFDPKARRGRGLLTLIHVKASHNAEPNRRISNGDYEIVVSQAVKNLRFLDRIGLVAGLELGKGKKVARATWHGSKHLGNRSEMLKALKAHGDRLEKLVVVLQPRITSTAYNRVDKHLNSAELAENGPDDEGRRMRQLDTLLVGAERDCQALGADFVVVADRTTS